MIRRSILSVCAIVLAASIAHADFGFIANRGTNKVSVINTLGSGGLGTWLQDITLPGLPWDVVALPPLDEVWVDANFKETQLTRMEVGQQVEISVDTYPDIEFTGRVESISPASGAEFSLIPIENATGNFTKLVQRIPVRIAIDPDALARRPLTTGMSVVVRVDTRPSGETETGSAAAQIVE